MTSLKTFLIGRFIRNARLFCLTFQTLLYPMHLALGDGLLYMRNPHGVPMCSYRSFTPTCTPSIPLYLGVLWGTRIVVTPELISKVLCIPRVDHPDYPSHKRLSSISKDELASLFCEDFMLWGGTLNFSTIEFAKGPQILNMVMTFVLSPRSQYNTIIEPCAHFLLSLMEYLSIDFPSHMIVSTIDCYQDTATRNKFIFPPTITCILTHMHVTIPPSPLFHVIGAISKESIRRSAE